MNDKEIEEMAKDKAFLILDMPESCSKCPFLNDNGDYPLCGITDETRGYTFNIRKNKMSKCPLKPLPENAVVITREEYDEFLRQNFTIHELKDCVKLASKETAREIFAELFYIASIYHSDIANILAWAKNKVKQYDVDLGE